MSNILGSAARLSKSAGAISAELQERNRCWILVLLARIATVEGQLRASGEQASGQPLAREKNANSGATLPEGPAVALVETRSPGATTAWGGQEYSDGTGYFLAEAEA